MLYDDGTECRVKINSGELRTPLRQTSPQITRESKRGVTRQVPLHIAATTNNHARRSADGAVTGPRDVKWLDFEVRWRGPEWVARVSDG